MIFDATAGVWDSVMNHPPAAAILRQHHSLRNARAGWHTPGTEAPRDNTARHGAAASVFFPVFLLECQYLFWRAVLFLELPLVL